MAGYKTAHGYLRVLEAALLASGRNANGEGRREGGVVADLRVATANSASRLNGRIRGRVEDDVSGAHSTDTATLHNVVAAELRVGARRGKTTSRLVETAKEHSKQSHNQEQSTGPYEEQSGRKLGAMVELTTRVGQPGQHDCEMATQSESEEQLRSASVGTGGRGEGEGTSAGGWKLGSQLLRQS